MLLGTGCKVFVWLPWAGIALRWVFIIACGFLPRELHPCFVYKSYGKASAISGTFCSDFSKIICWYLSICTDCDLIL